MRDYLKDWQQERQSDDEAEGGISGDEEDDTAEADGGDRKEGSSSINGKMARLSVNGDEGEEVGKRKA